MTKFEIAHLGSPEALAAAAAQRWIAEIGSNCSTAAPYCVALFGGRIAVKFLSTVASLTRANSAFSHVRFFWSDERCVPPESPESNYRLAVDALFSRTTIAPSQIHRIRGEISPADAAKQAEGELRRIAHSNAAGLPVFDLVFLGMGEDGHVASLFPDELPRAFDDASVFRPVISRHKPPPQRITMGYLAIAAAREVWVLVSGPGKRDALRKAVSLDPGMPLGRVLSSRSKTMVFTDFDPANWSASP